MPPDPKPAKRIKATRKDWQTMRWHKLTQGCRLCGTRDRVEFHHLVGRDLGGDDVLNNLVPLCPQHHQAVEERKPEASLLGHHLLYDEVQYVIGKKGWDFFDLYYPPWDDS